MITGNKGEWSEIYTLFKLLGDTNLQPGNEHIEKLSDVFYPIIKILRTESSGNYEYSINDDVVVISGGTEMLRVPISEFKDMASLLLSKIKSNSNRTFSIPEIEEFMNEINCISLKASSSAKTDITIVIHDQKTNQEPILGFSIKSQLGSPSTLLNAGKTTNFIFELTGPSLNSWDIDEVNSLFITRGGKESIDVKGRTNLIIDKGSTLKFSNTQNLTFGNNLILIDSLLPNITAEIVKHFYAGESSKLSEITNLIEKENPLGFDNSDNHKFYSYKIKRLLTDIALGMMPSKVWDGQYDATGGYLIVKENGDVLCYHIYNKNEFENYLLNNTKLETASTSRHEFGELYQDGDRLLFKLNLQIRFIK